MNISIYPMTKRELLIYKKQLQHKKILRRRIAICTLSLLLIFLFVLSFNNMVQATEELPETTYKYFTYYTVDKGDTLWSMAEEYIDYEFYDSIHEYVEEVKEINHMCNDIILVGETIVIPYFSNIYQ
ncbi:MAG: LysM peptidoglycan-binding domain-containing protein [Lachnospiraceae bacterium]|nr:LysM peptidoglycan-binding domain-containing protein [Lachnospiraceae bacterium]